MREILRHAGRTGLLCALAATTGPEGSRVVDEVIGEATEAEPVACDSALTTAVRAVSVSRMVGSIGRPDSYTSAICGQDCPACRAELAILRIRVVPAGTVGGLYPGLFSLPQ